MQTTPSPDNNVVTSFFDMSPDDLMDWHDFYFQNDEALPTDLMVAMIDKGLIIRD